MIAARPAIGRLEAVIDAPGQTSGSESFLRAARHSARVRLLRKAIPIGVLVAVSGLLAVWLFDPFRQVFPNFTVQGFDLSATKVTMEKPKLAGFKKDNRPYEVVAKSAIQDITKPSIVNLIEMDAHLAMENGGSAVLKAKRGIYDTQNETLEVREDVRVQTTTGYDIHLESAKMKFKTGDISSEQPVNVRMQGGEISADSLQMIDNGKKVTFIGNVRSRLEPVSDDTGNKQAPIKEQLRQ